MAQTIANTTHTNRGWSRRFLSRALAFICGTVALLLPASPALAQTLTLANQTFPVTTVYQSSTVNLTLTINSNVAYISPRISSAYTEFSLQSVPNCNINQMLPAGTNCTLVIQFTPRLAGHASSPVPLSRTAVLQISYFDLTANSVSQQNFILSGSGTTPTGVFTPGLISDIVGSDTTPHNGYAGDGGPASAAYFAAPGAIAMDALGNIYIADTGNNVVRALYKAGYLPNVSNPVVGDIYTIAGIAPVGGVSSAGPGTDGVAAIQSALNGPTGVTVDGLGNVYIADTNNQAVRMVSAVNGVITTVAGTLNSVETPGTGFAGDGGPANAAQLYLPAGIAVDGSGNLFIADSGNNAVRVVYAAGNIPNLTAPTAGDIYTVAGGPANVAAPNNGDGGAATLANLSTPLSVTIDAFGNFYIADSGDLAVRRVDSVSGNISSVYQGGDSPYSLSVDASDNIYFTQHNSCNVSQYNPTTQQSTPTSMVVAGDGLCAASGDGGLATSAGLSGAEGLVVDGAGNLYLLESDGVRLVTGNATTMAFGAINVGTNSPVLTAVLTDEDIHSGAYYGGYGYALAPTYFQLTPYGSPFVTVPYSNPTVNNFDCENSNSLGPGQSCGASFTFEPIADGAATASGYDNDGYEIQFSGTGTGPLPTATLTGTPANFVSVVNESASPAQVFTLTNTSNVALTISYIGFSSFGFSETDTCGFSTGTGQKLAGGASCQISVTFRATTSGTTNTTLSVTDNASSGSGTQSLALTGMGDAPIATLSPTTVTFISQAVGTTSAPQAIKLSNTGNAPLNLPNFATTGTAPFSLTGNEPGSFAFDASNCGATVAAGSYCTINVTFTPTSSGYFTATFDATDDSGGQRGVFAYVTQSVQLIGPATVNSGTSSFTLSNGVFPPTAVGQSTTQTVTLTLNNQDVLQSIAIQAGSTEYSLGTVTGCAVDGATVNPSGTVCSIPVTFTPAEAGVRNAALVVVTHEGTPTVATPYSFGLTGIGTGPVAALTPGIITTYVNGSGGVATPVVANVPASQAEVGYPAGMALDSAGDLFLSDNQNELIWKVNTSGIINVYAGTPFTSGGYLESLAGDGGPAIGAALGYVGPIALDTKGGLYLGETDAVEDPPRIRYINPATGIITTVVGFIPPSAWAATTSFSLDTRIVVTVSSVKYLFTAIQGGTSAATAPLWPTTLNVTVLDGTVIWKNQGVYFGGAGCSAQTDTWGDGCTALQAKVGTVAGLIVDTSGNLYFSDTGYVISTNPTTTTYHSMVRRVDAVTGIVSLYAGNGTQGHTGDGGAATQAEVNAGDLAFDSNGNLYFVDSNLFVRTVNASSGTITTITGKQENSSVQDECAGGSGDGGLASAATFSTLTGIAIDAANDIYVVDQGSCHVRRIDAGTQMIYNVAGEPGEYGNYFVTGDLGQPGSDGSAIEAALAQPEFLRLDSMANVYIGQASRGIRKVNISQSVLPFNGPYDGSNTQQIDTVSAPLTATVLNAGNGGYVSFASPFTASPWGISNTDFIRDVTNPTGASDCYDVGSVGSGYECPVSVDFTPPVAGTLTGTNTVTDTAINTPQSIKLIGIGAGTPPLVTLLPPLLSFSEPQGGVSASQNLTLTNNDVNPLPISGITITGPNASAFSQTNNCGSSLAAGAYCTIAVTFSPPIVGGNFVAFVPPDNLTATVSVTDTAANSPQTAQLIGTGTLPVYQQPQPAVLPDMETIHVTDAVSLVPATVLPPDLETIRVTDKVSLVASTLLSIDEVIHVTDSPSVSQPPATPVITWANPAAIAYGTALGTTQLDATASVAGTFLYSPAAGTVLTAGTQTLSVTFTPTDTVHYAIATKTVQIVVNQVVPVLTWSNPAAISYGTALSTTQLNATASVPGSFVYSPAAGTVLTAGTQTLAVTFTPTDMTDYLGATASVKVLVNQVAPVVTWANPGAIVYGTPLGATQLDATASVPGSFVYSPASGTVLNAGTQSLGVKFTPTDSTDYLGVSTTVSLSVTQAPLTITVANATRAYGAANPSLTGTVSGIVNNDAIAVAYSTTATANSAPGSYPIQAVPSGTALSNYTQTITPGTLTVTDATLTLTANNASRVYGTANPAFTGTISGVANGDAFIESFTTTATLASPAGTYPIVPSAAGANIGDYTVQAASGTLTVAQAPSTTAVAPSTSLVQAGSSVTFTATVASTTTGIPTGSVTFYDGTAALGQGMLNASGQATYTASSLSAGSDSITAVYSGDTNFLTSTSSAIVETVVDFNFTFTALSQTVQPGGTAVYTLSITPTNGTFLDPVTFTINGLPPGATYTFSPSSLPAGSPAATVTLTIQIPATTAQRSAPIGTWPAALALTVLPLLAWRKRAQRRWLTVAVLAIASLAAALGASGCGGGYFDQNSQSYNLTVTAVSGSLSHSTNATLTVN